MTANNAPSPCVVTPWNAYYPGQPNEEAGYEAFHAFDHSGSTNFLCYADIVSLIFDLGSGNDKTVISYNIVFAGDDDKYWHIDGSANGTNWTTLHTRTGGTVAGGTVYSYNISIPASYRYFRYYQTGSANAYCGLVELELIEAPPPEPIEETLEGAAGVEASFDGNLVSMEGDLPGNAGVEADFAGSSLSDTLPAAAGVRMALSGTTDASRAMAAAAGVLADFDGFNWSDFLRVYRDRISIRYILTLSDGILEDLIIPISSFQGRFRSGDPTFLSVVVPGNDQYADIAARDEGDLILTMQYLVGGVVFHSEEICTVDLEDIRIDEGASSVSVELSGHRTVTNTPKTTQLSGSSYKAVSDGKIRYRCTPDLYLRPGDTVVVGDDTFTAGVISWTVDPSQQTMEVEEA